MNTTQRQRGSTLIDVCAACAMGSIAMALVLPSYHNWIERERRTDAVNALNRVQQAQADYHASHGGYALRLDALPGTPRERSDRGLYRITMFSDGPDSFEVHASALPDGPQARDPSCAQVTLRVNNGAVAYEPSLRCWNP